MRVADAALIDAVGFVAELTSREELYFHLTIGLFFNVLLKKFERLNGRTGFTRNCGRDTDDLFVVPV